MSNAIIPPNDKSDFWKLFGVGTVGAIIGAAGTLLADAILSDTSSDEDEAEKTIEDTEDNQVESSTEADQELLHASNAEPLILE